MAHAKRRENGRWTAVYIDPRGREKSAGTFDEEDRARRVAQEQETYLRNGSTGPDPVTKATITIGEYWKPWLRNHRVQPSTRSNYDSVLRNHILPVLRDVRVAELQRQAVRQLLTSLAEAEAGVSVQRHVRSSLSAMMQTAWDDGYRENNPVRGLKVEKNRSKDIIVMTREQFGEVFEALPTWAAQMFANFIVSTGCRFGEAVVLLVCDLDLADLNDSAVNITKALQDIGRKHHPDGKSRFLIGPTKTHEDRTVGIDCGLAADLQEWIAERNLGPYDLLFPRSLVAPLKRQRDRQVKVVLTEELVATLGTLVGPNGKEYRHGTWHGYVTGKCRGCVYCLQAFADYRYELEQRKRSSGHARVHPINGSDRFYDESDFLYDGRWAEVWREACAKVELPFRAPTAYQLRHTHASWAIEDGENVKDVMDRLGHKDLATTSRYVKKVGAGRKVAETMAAKRTWGKRRAA